MPKPQPAMEAATQAGKSRNDLSEIAAQFSADRDPLRVFETRTNQVDEIVRSAVAATLAPKLSTRFAAVAVGGYGRRELFPYSDVDLLLVFESERDLSEIKE